MTKFMQTAAFMKTCHLKDWEVPPNRWYINNKEILTRLTIISRLRMIVTLTWWTMLMLTIWISMPMDHWNTERLQRRMLLLGDRRWSRENLIYCEHTSFIMRRFKVIFNIFRSDTFFEKCNFLQDFPSSDV